MKASKAEAVAKALDITEILEHILKFLPLPDIAGGQRICRQWKATIETSPTLRQRRFLDVDPEKTPDDRATHPILSNPFTTLRSTWKCDLKQIDTEVIMSWQPGCWEEAFITLPPLKRLSVGVTRISGRCGTGLANVVEDSDGIRFKVLMKELRDRLGRYPLRGNDIVELEELNGYRLCW